MGTLELAHANVNDNSSIFKKQRKSTDDKTAQRKRRSRNNLEGAQLSSEELFLTLPSTNQIEIESTNSSKVIDEDAGADEKIDSAATSTQSSRRADSSLSVSASVAYLNSTNHQANAINSPDLICNLLSRLSEAALANADRCKKTFRVSFYTSVEEFLNVRDQQGDHSLALVYKAGSGVRVAAWGLSVRRNERKLFAVMAAPWGETHYELSEAICFENSVDDARSICDCFAEQRTIPVDQRGLLLTILAALLIYAKSPWRWLRQEYLVDCTHEIATKHALLTSDACRRLLSQDVGELCEQVLKPLHDQVETILFPS